MINASVPSGPKDGNRHWKVITDPAVEPITLTELKDFARISGSDEDTILTGFITGVRIAAENYTGRAFIHQKIRMILDYWPGTVYGALLPQLLYNKYQSGSIIELPRPPLVSVDSINLIDEDGLATLYAATQYYTVTESMFGQIVIRNGSTPPINLDRYTGGIRIDFYAGYASVAASVPQPIKDGLKLWAAATYDSRAISSEPPPDARPFFDQFRVINL